MRRRRTCRHCIFAGQRGGRPRTGEDILKQGTQPNRQTWSRWLRLAIYVVCAAAFIADLISESSLVFGVFYIPLVATAVYHNDPRAPWRLALLASLMVAIGFFVPTISPDLADALVNRGLSIVAIFITAYLVHHGRHAQERLAEETVRAEAADNFRARLFNNLSHELRTPLTAILGFADLLLVSARPDQRAPLGHVQAGGRRLLATVDNLIDLTQIDDRTMRARPLDLSAVLAYAVEISRPLAAERQVELTMVLPEPDAAKVIADGWALRRIVDNLIANGIKFTEPGGSVEVSARRTADGIAATVKDDGPGMPPDVLEQIGEPFFQADAGRTRRFEGMGAGLALSLRLADLMGAALHFDSAPGKGTTASLVLPVQG